MVGEKKLACSLLRFQGSRIQQRWVFAILGLLGFANAYTMRHCLSLTITAMVKTTNVISNRTTSNDACPANEHAIANSSRPTGGTYEWDEYTQGIILCSFSAGYIVNQIPGGILAQKFGGKYVFGLGLFSTAVLTLLTPIVVQVYDATGLVIVRFLMGIGEGAMLPSSSVLIARWAPAQERTKIGSTVLSGVMLGTVLGNVVSGVLIHNSPIGWQIVFYFFGISGILWFVCWVFLCFDGPDVHPFISEEEREYLRETTGTHPHEEVQSTPWRHILTSVPVWALLIGKSGYVWGAFTILTDLPKYMSDVLRFSIRTNGFVCALPFVVKMVVTILASWLSDWLIKSGKMSRTNVRRTINTTGTALSAILLLAASYSGCDRMYVVIFFTLCVGAMGFSGPCVLVNGNDLSPNYAGAIMSFTAIFSSIYGALAPYVAGILTPNRALSEWRTMFWITSIIIFASSLIFQLWGNAEVQCWNDPDFGVKKRQDTKMKEEVPFLEKCKSTKNEV